LFVSHRQLARKRSYRRAVTPLGARLGRIHRTVYPRALDQDEQQAKLELVADTAAKV
jgi:hypothetical protein